MVFEDIANKILERLQKQGPTNTFRLASESEIDRYKLLKIIKKLEEKQAIELSAGVVKFLKFPSKKRTEIKNIHAIPKKKSKAYKKIKKKRTKRKLILHKSIQNENKELKEKLLTLETTIKKQSNIQNKLKNQAKHITKLEETIKELQQKSVAHPKIIRRTIIKNIIEKVRAIPEKKPESHKKIKKKRIKRRKAKPKKFKFNIGWMKNIQKIRIPKRLDTKGG